ncbi:hypothetical protein GQX74_004268, partial [Glossina fuscipes]
MKMSKDRFRCPSTWMNERIIMTLKNIMLILIIYLMGNEAVIYEFAENDLHFRLRYMPEKISNVRNIIFNVYHIQAVSIILQITLVYVLRGSNEVYDLSQIWSSVTIASLSASSSSPSSSSL